MKEAKEIFNNLPQWSKGIIAIAVIGGIGLIGYRIYKSIDDKNKLQDSKETSDSAEDEYKRLLRQGQKLSFPETNYLSVVNTVVNSLSGCETYMAEDDVVWSILNVVKKPIDWYFLVSSFGSKMIDNCGWGTGETAYALPDLLRTQLGNLSPSAYYLKTNYQFLQGRLKEIGVNI